MFGNLFAAKPQQPNGQQQQNTQQNQQNNSQQNTQQSVQNNQPGNNVQNGATLPNSGNNSGQPGNGGNTGNQGTPNPLDSYSKMFDNPSTDGDKAPSFTIDPKIMDQVVSSQDFTQGIDPEVMQKAMSGDMQSFMQIIQSVGRNSYRASIEHGGMLTDKFVGAREAHGSKGLSGRVRQELTNHALSSTPNYQHPVVKKQLTEIAQRLQQANPDAGPQEIADSAKQYLQQLASALNPEDTAKSNKDKPEQRGEEYWNNFFSQDSQE